jgi:hypothetical protein
VNPPNLRDYEGEPDPFQGVVSLLIVSPSPARLPVISANTVVKDMDVVCGQGQNKPRDGSDGGKMQADPKRAGPDCSTPTWLLGRVVEEIAILDAIRSGVEVDRL